MASLRSKEPSVNSASMGKIQRARLDSIATRPGWNSRAQEEIQQDFSQDRLSLSNNSAAGGDPSEGLSLSYSPRGVAPRGSMAEGQKGLGGDSSPGGSSAGTSKSIPALPMSRLGEEEAKGGGDNPLTVSNPSSSESPRGYIQAPAPKARGLSSRVKSAPPVRPISPLAENDSAAEFMGMGGYGEEDEPRTRWTKTMQQMAAIKNRGYMAKVKAVSFSGPEYNDPSLPFGASIDFYKLLAPHPDAIWKPRPGGGSPGKSGDPNSRRLHLLMPPTIAHHNFDVTAFFTSPDGYVSRKDDLHHTDVYRMMKPRWRAQETLLPSWPAAVFKSRRAKSRNDSVLVQMGELLVYSDGTKNTGHCCLQQYVHCASPKANVVRAVWRDRGRPGYAILIVNKVEKGARPTRLELSPSREQLAGMDALEVAKAVRMNACNLGYITVTEMPQACVILKASGKGFQEPIDIAGRIASYVERGPKFGFQFEELVADFIRDSNGRWWFLQVKAFKVKQARVAWVPSPDAVPTTREFSTERKAGMECRGDYCNTLKKQEDLAAFEEEATTVASSMKAKGFETLSSAEKRQYMERWKEAKKGPASGSGNGEGPKEGIEKEGGKGESGGGTEKMMLLPLKSIVLDRLDMETDGVKWYVEGKGGRWMQLNVDDCITLEDSFQYGQLLVQLTEGAEADLRLMQYWAQRKRSKLEAGKRLKRLACDNEAMPRPKRKGPLLPHNRFHSFYYSMVPLCHDCFRVYLSKDQKRHLGRLSLLEDSPQNKTQQPTPQRTSSISFPKDPPHKALVDAPRQSLVPNWLSTSVGSLGETMSSLSRTAMTRKSFSAQGYRIATRLQS